MRKIEKRPWAKHEISGRKSEITGSGLQISKKQSIPHKDKKSLFIQFTVYKLQFPLPLFLHPRPLFLHPPPPPPTVVSSSPPVVSSTPSPPPPVVSSNGYPNEIQENSTAFFQPKMKFWIFCENITKFANSFLGALKNKKWGLKKWGVKKWGGGVRLLTNLIWICYLDSIFILSQIIIMIILIQLQLFSIFETLHWKAKLNIFSELWITFLNFGAVNYFYFRSCGMKSWHQKDCHWYMIKLKSHLKRRNCYTQYVPM